LDSLILSFLDSQTIGLLDSLDHWAIRLSVFWTRGLVDSQTLCLWAFGLLDTWSLILLGFHNLIISESQTLGILDSLTLGLLSDYLTLVFWDSLALGLSDLWTCGL
jgi:hypothetical protein